MVARTRSASQVRYTAGQFLSKRFMRRIQKSMEQYSSPQIDIRAKEVIMLSDSRAADPRMITAKYTEIRDLICRRAFKVISKEEISEGANVFTARFLLAIKPTVDGEIKFKARYVAAATS